MRPQALGFHSAMNGADERIKAVLEKAADVGEWGRSLPDGGFSDGLALALTSSLHIRDGLPLEGSWDNYFYTRQWNTPPEMTVVVMPPTNGEPGGAGELGVARSTPCPRTSSPSTASASRSSATTASGCSGCCATCSRSTDPKYGCGLTVCKACTSHLNGERFNPCSVPVSDIKESDEITTIEGLPATVGRDLHPMQEAWLEMDVAQCGYCQPGQIMAAAALVKEKGSTITDDDLDEIRNICRCGTYHRIREAIKAGAAKM